MPKAKYPNVREVIGGSDEYKILKGGDNVYLLSWNSRYGYVGVCKLAGDSWEELFFAQGEEADEWLDMLDEKGPGKTLDYMCDVGLI